MKQGRTRTGRLLIEIWLSLDQPHMSLICFLSLVVPCYFQILIRESEDLLSPNYQTVKVIQEVKKNNCNLYAVLLANGEQVVRFLTFGDK